MKTEVFVLCDAATDSHGKLNVLGAFDHIFAPKPPVVHPACAIAARMRFSRIEEGNHRVKINVMDLDGKLVLPDREQVIAARMPPGSESVAVNVILNIQGLRIEKFGDYSIVLAVDGREEGSMPLAVRPMPGQS
jgi:hypothetical protein